MSGVKREWRPGDVAILGAFPAFRTTKGWAYRDGSVGGLHQDKFDDICPLAVIDPEDREQVERLIRLQDKHFNDGHRESVHSDDLRDMQAALREFANPTPPKPPEPTGLGAVVEDDEGVRWVRTDADPESTTASWESENGSAPYSCLTAVRVLSEGVS